MENQELFICQCESLDHLVSIYHDEPWNTLYMSVHIKPETNKWKRIWCAIKYVFGYRSRHGDFDDFILKSEDVERLKVILGKIKETPTGTITYSATNPTTTTSGNPTTTAG
jgi:hypothetical protein